MAEELYIPGTPAESPRCLQPDKCTTIQWDGSDSIRHKEGGQAISWPVIPSFYWPQKIPTAVMHTKPHLETAEICLMPGLLLQAVIWEEEAVSLAFSLDTVLLRDLTPDKIPQASGELVWFPRQEPTAPSMLLVSPVLLGYSPGESHAAQQSITVIPCLRSGDPLLNHMALALKAAISAMSAEQQLYAEALATALIVHFLRRYALTQAIPQSQDASSGGLPPYKLQRTLTYIHEHLEEKLSLPTLAAVAQMSSSHFAHLFKQATGHAPRQYVTRCRIKHAKQLLLETRLPLIEIGYRIGCVDPSHFSALFRQQVGMSPSVYRRGIDAAA